MAITVNPEGAHGGDKKSNPINGHDFGRMISLEQFTVNLSTSGTIQPKFARVNIAIEVPSEDAELEINQKMPRVRNTIIDLFNSKRPIDLQNTEGRNLLKEQILNALNSFLVTGKVKGVFFTSFAVSS
jgi:flagellar FliL protein